LERLRSTQNRHHAYQIDDGLRRHGLPLRRVRRIAFGILSDVGAVVARQANCEQRHPKCTARPVPIDRYDSLAFILEGLHIVDIAALLWRPLSYAPLDGTVHQE
jgi:hypothetical protein